MWLCQCGHGNLVEEEPPENCDVCGFNLWAYFNLYQEEECREMNAFATDWKENRTMDDLERYADSLRAARKDGE